MSSKILLTLVSLLITGLCWPGTADAYDPLPLCSYPSTSQSLVLFTPAWLHEASSASPPMMCSASEAEPRFDRDLGARDARTALRRARRLADVGRHEEAILALRVVEQALPRIADRVALEEAQVRMAEGADERACAAFARAAESPLRSIAARGRIGHVRCLLARGDRAGVRAFEDLRRSYPELPQADELRVLLALAHEGWGETDEAVEILRTIDLLSPGSQPAARARQELSRLRGRGVEVRELTLLQQVDRAERLVHSGPFDLAHTEIERLRALPLPRSLQQQVARQAARIARVEGRWSDAQTLLRQAQGLPTLDAEERVAMAEQIDDLGRAAESRDDAEVRQRIRGLTRGRPLSTQPTGRVLGILSIAARSGLRDVVDDSLRDLVRRRLPPGSRVEVAILAAGTGDDALIVELLGGVRTHPSFGVAGRYHYGRALERLGRITDARAEYTHVIERDSVVLPYYALWARQRLRATANMRNSGTQAPLAELLPSLTSCEEGPYTPALDDLEGKGEHDGNPLEEAHCTSCTFQVPPNPFAAEDAENTRGADAPADPLADADAEAIEIEMNGRNAPRPSIDLTPEQIAALLEPLALQHGEAYPWIGRALDLVRIGETQAATDELHEAFVAWKDAHGGGSLRADLAAILRGSAPPRQRVTPDIWRDRRRFPAEARATLARVSAALGDHGLAIRFGGNFRVAGPRPRAYETLVVEAAQRHGIEPELLFAVMRVESVYNPRIISYAGAIGLMQIMPRTGNLIAHRLGREDFTVDQLLNPEVNIEFAAWYLASLIRRFDGRIPLAIASYNGGPHNVRRWMRDHSETMTLEAFLERIPFDQTHRYVRRVLTHYEAYRAQRGLPMARLDVTLPRAQPDPIAF